jgi:hypothetical protein
MIVMAWIVAYAPAVQLPDLSRYRLHRVEPVAEFEGTAVPGLRAEFFRREIDGRTASAGRYRYEGRELLLAWGYVGEEHCRYAWVHRDGEWEPAGPGCPTVRVLRDEDRVTGFQVRDRHGRWIGTAAPVAA